MVIPMRDDSTYTEIDEYGTKKWLNANGGLHREDGPALIYMNNDKVWFKNAKMHRLDGPAVIYACGDKRWYINNEEYDKNDPIFDEAREKYPERFI